MIDWLRDHQALMYSLTGASAAIFIATLIFVPLLVARLPADYFAHNKRPEPQGWLSRQSPAIRTLLKVLKNLAGYLLIIAGVVMILLPGQGLLTILVGFFMLDFPGKYRAEKWLFSFGWVNRPVNWFRRKRGIEPLTLAGSSHQQSSKQKAPDPA
jgi:hypothetical protein